MRFDCCGGRRASRVAWLAGLSGFNEQIFGADKQAPKVAAALVQKMHSGREKSDADGGLCRMNEGRNTVFGSYRAHRFGLDPGQRVRGHSCWRIPLPGRAPDVRTFGCASDQACASTCAAPHAKISVTCHSPNRAIAHTSRYQEQGISTYGSLVSSRHFGGWSFRKRRRYT